MRGNWLWVAVLVGSGCSFDSGGNVGDDGGDIADAGVDAVVVQCTRDQECETPPDLCHLAGLCNPSTQRCEFPTKDCSASGDQCNNGTCEMATGDCVATPAFEGNDCDGGTTCEAFGACGSFDDTCDESGTRSRDCTDRMCSAGACVEMPRVESEGCTRDQTGVTCGTTTCGTFGTCTDFSDTCDEHGTRYRDCTDFKCGGGACLSNDYVDSGACTRASRDGITCAPDSCMPFEACTGFDDVCDETGIRQRTCTPFVCNSEACSSGTPYTQTVSCSRPSTDGVMCGMDCTDVCSGMGDCATVCMGSCTTVCTDVMCSGGVCGG